MRRLLIRPGAIGDCILSLPALEHLRTDYTEVWAPSAVIPLYGAFDRARSLASTGLDLFGLPGLDAPPALIAALRSFDSIESWYGENRPEFRHAAKSLPISFHRSLPPAGDVHAADFFARQVGCPTPAIPRIEVPNVAARSSVIIHPFSGGATKNWPLDCFRDLANRLPLTVEWSAGPEEELPEASRIENLYDLATWIAGARLFVGNDAGITHLAAAVGAPVVALFCKTDPAVWAPRGNNVRVLAPPESVQAVLAECLRYTSA